MKVFWTLEAQGDVHDVFNYIALDKPDAAERVIVRLSEAGERLGQTPYWGRPRQTPNSREVAVPGLPYLLIYEVRDDTVVIQRVVHGARRR